MGSSDSMKEVIRSRTVTLEDLKAVCLSVPGVDVIDIDRNIHTREVRFIIEAPSRAHVTEVEFQLERWRPADMTFKVMWQQ